MKRIGVMAALLLILFPITASPPIGVYAVVDRVVFEPNESSPERVQVWGVFAASVDGGTEREAPAYGYLYYQLDGSSSKVARQEWADLKKLAGTGQCVAFAGRDNGRLGARIRKPAEKADKPDVYPVALGLFRLRDTSPLADEMRSFPIPANPSDGGRAGPGQVTLRVRNILSREHPQAQYFFEIENGAGEKEKSEPQTAGAKETEWTPRMKLKPGKYTWRAWAKQGDWKGPVASARFTVQLDAQTDGR